MKILFILSLALIFYVYLGYPIIIYLLSMIIRKNVNKDDSFRPFVSIITSAFNEEHGIEKTLQNKLELDYPSNKLEIIIVSDESTDQTDEIVKKYEKRGVRLIRQEPRAGKTSALNLAVPQAKGEIIVFSDANSIYQSDAIIKLVRNFNDPDVGYVTGKMIYANPDGSTVGDGCSAYMKYENLLRKLESSVGSIVGVDGGVDAVRKELYKPMNQDQLPDFVLPLNVVKQGYRVVYEPEAKLNENSLNSAEDEYRMRIRVTLRALWALKDMKELLNIKQYPIFSWQLWSHKVLRYLCFIFLMTAYISNGFLIERGLSYQIFFGVQSFIYVTAFLSQRLSGKGYNVSIMRFIYYFILINMACAHACVKFVFGQKVVVWNPRKG